MHLTQKMIWLKTTVLFSEIQLPIVIERAIFWIHKCDCLKRHVFHEKLTD